MWKVIKGFSKYMASSDGEIMRIDTQKMLKPRPLSSGYLRVYLTDDNGKRHDLLIHRIICLVFNGEPTKNANCVNHIDCNKINNNARNLEWCSYEENMRHASKNHLLKSQSKHMKKLNDTRRIPVVAKSIDGKVILSFPCVMEARLAGHTSVSYSIKHKATTKNGLIWQYAT